jgi:hypothetical protein
LREEDMNETIQTSAPAKKPRPRAAGTRKPARKLAAKKKAPAGAASRQAKALRAMLSEVSKSAARAGSKISRLSREGGGAAKKAIGSATAATRRAVKGSVREWKKLDTPRKIEFVATLLSALAAASGTIAHGRKKKSLSGRAGSLFRKALR